MSTAIAEFLIEDYFFPEMKCTVVTMLGAVFLLLGIGIRAWGEFYGGFNYTYEIQTEPN